MGDVKDTTGRSTSQLTWGFTETEPPTIKDHAGAGPTFVADGQLGLHVGSLTIRRRIVSNSTA